MLRPDPMMMSGSSFKSDSTHKYCPVQSTPTLNPQFNDTRLFKFESRCSSMSFTASLEFEKSIDVFESIIIPQTLKSCRRALPFSHLHLDCGTMLRCVCLSESFLTLHRSGSHNQAARCGKHLEFQNMLLTDGSFF